MYIYNLWADLRKRATLVQTSILRHCYELEIYEISCHLLQVSCFQSCLDSLFVHVYIKTILANRETEKITVQDWRWVLTWVSVYSCRLYVVDLVNCWWMEQAVQTLQTVFKRAKEVKQLKTALCYCWNTLAKHDNPICTRMFKLKLILSRSC